MRQSQSRAGSRAVRAGIAAAATAAAVVAGTATPAFATDVTVTLSPTTAPIGGGSTTTAGGTGVLSGITTTPGGRFIASSATCPLTFGTTSTTNLAATVSKTDNDTAVITVPALAAGTYKACIYAGTASTSAIAGHSSNNLTVAAITPTLNTTAGPLAGGNAITATGTVPYLTSVSAPAAVFTTATCPTTYATTTGNITATVARTSTTVATVTVPTTLTANTAYNVCLYAGNTAGTSVLIGSAAGYRALPVSTLSPTAGNSGGGNTITVSTATPVITGASPAVTFTKDDCPATYSTGTSVQPFASGTLTKISTSKIAVQVPTDVVVNGSDATTAWNVCLYASSSGALLATPGVYTVAPVLAINLATLDVSGGPAQGGTMVTVSGASGIPTAADALLTASIGGSELKDIHVVDNTSFSGVTTAHSAGAATLSVTTAAGTKSNGPTFTYSYGITVAPNTAAPSSTPTLDIQGAGFSTLTFGATSPANTGARVFLVDNTWYGTAVSGGAFGTKPVTQCTGVIVISDNELICTLDLANTLTAGGAVVTGPAVPVPVGTYTVAVVNNAAASSLNATTDFSRISSQSTFTVSTY